MQRTVHAGSRKQAETGFPGVHAPQQVALNFDVSLLELYPTFQSVLRAAVNTCGKPEKAVAADCGMSPQEFSRRMNDNANDPGHPFPVSALDALLDSIDSTMPIQWLVLKYMQDPEARKAHAMATIARAAHVLENALAALK